jgi:excinuclease UvrABC ATPase subunit
MKDGDKFDPDEAQFGDVFTYGPPSKDFFTYLTRSAIMREGQHMVVFQRPNSHLASFRELNEDLKLLVFNEEATKACKPSAHRSTNQGEQTMSKSILSTSRTIDLNIAAILREDANTVDVQFTNDGSNYTYVTNLKLEVDDYVAVPNKSCTGFNVGKVTAVHDDLNIPPNSDMLFKWVAAKLDLTEHLANMERNREIEQAVADAYQTNARRSMRAAIMANVDGETAARLQAVLGGSATLAAPEV